MKRLLILLLTGLFAQLVVSCYPEGADNIEDYDVAITNYDKGADFSAFTTFRFLTRSFILRMTIVPANLHMNLMMLSSKL